MTQVPDFDFPILDAAFDNREEDGRVVLTEHGFLEPRIDETDDYVNIPLRVTHNPLAGCVLEIGPYELDERDVRKLRGAVAAYDRALRRPTIRRIK